MEENKGWGKQGMGQTRDGAKQGSVPTKDKTEQGVRRNEGWDNQNGIYMYSEG